MIIKNGYIDEYKEIIQSTNLQKGYQELMAFLRGLRTHLSGNMSEYRFTGNVVENNMDYSYFQLTGDVLQSKGLKFVVAFVHKEFEHEVWLSGINRKIQIHHHNKLCKVKHPYTMSPDPNRFDYILKERLFQEINYADCKGVYDKAELNISAFADKITKIL